MQLKFDGVNDRKMCNIADWNSTNKVLSINYVALCTFCYTETTGHVRFFSTVKAFF